MDSTYLVGLLLVGLSAVLLASHWQQWRESHRRVGDLSRGRARNREELQGGGRKLRDSRTQAYMAATLRRRCVASSLVGLVGLTLMSFETVPRTPLSITAYLLSLVLMACWILWLACLDILADRRYRTDQQLDQIADKLRHHELESRRADSVER